MTATAPPEALTETTRVFTDRDRAELALWEAEDRAVLAARAYVLRKAFAADAMQALNDLRDALTVLRAYDEDIDLADCMDGLGQNGARIRSLAEAGLAAALAGQGYTSATAGVVVARLLPDGPLAETSNWMV